MLNKLNFKLLNYLIISLIFLIFYVTRSLWNSIILFIIEILKPLIIAVLISYICNLYLDKLNKIFRRKYISVIVFILIFLLILYFSCFVFLPLIIKQCIEFVNIIIFFLTDFSRKYDIDLMNIYDKFVYFKEILPSIGSFVNFNLFSSLFKYITFLVLIIILSIYLFLDFNKIIDVIKNSCLKNKKFYKYLSTLNFELSKYFSSFFVLIILNIFLYMFVFFVVGHPNYMFLGLCAGIFSIIPIFGGILTNVLALISAFVVNYGLFIRTLIGILVLSILDGYVVSPLVYSRGNKLHPLLIVVSIYVGGKIFGIFGTVFSIPLLIFVLVSFKFLNKKN